MSPKGYVEKTANTPFCDYLLCLQSCTNSYSLLLHRVLRKESRTYKCRCNFAAMNVQGGLIPVWGDHLFSLQGKGPSQNFCLPYERDSSSSILDHIHVGCKSAIISIWNLLLFATDCAYFRANVAVDMIVRSPRDLFKMSVLYSFLFSLILSISLLRHELNDDRQSARHMPVPENGTDRCQS